MFAFTSIPVLVFVFADLILILQVAVPYIFNLKNLECPEHLHLTSNINLISIVAFIWKTFLIIKCGTNFQRTNCLINSISYKLIYLIHIISLVQIFMVYEIAKCGHNVLSISLIATLIMCLIQYKFF